MAGISIISTLVTTTVYVGQGSYAADLTITSAGVIAPDDNQHGIVGAAGISGVSIVNNGTVHAYLDGISLDNGGLISNKAGAYIYGLNDAVFVETARGTVLNAGNITGQVNGIVLSLGGYISNSAGGLISGVEEAIHINAGSGTVINSGTISNTDQLGVYFQGARGTVTNNAGGLISSHSWGVFFDEAPGVVMNAGTIASTRDAGVALENGGHVTNSAAAYISGYLFGVTIAAAAGTLLNAGTITASHEDGVSMSLGGSVTNSSTAALISGAEAGIDLRGATGTVLNAGTITGGTNFGIALEDGGYITNSSNALISGVDGAGFSALAGTVRNSGTITGTDTTAGSGIVLSAGGYVANSAAAALITGYNGIEITAASGTVVNAGTITAQRAGIYLGAGGNATNSTGGHISGEIAGIYAGGTGILLNDGAVTSADGDGIVFKTGGSITNNAGALITGNNTGVLFDGAGTMLNTGSIGGTTDGIVFELGGDVTNSTAGRISGHNFFGVYISGATGTVLNAGSTTGGLDGVGLIAGGYVANNGAQALIAGGTGIYITGTAGTVLNSGTISGVSYGVVLHAGGTVVDSGLISGSVDAINFGTRAGTLIVEHGARLTGDVIAATSTANLLEFAGTTASYRGGIGTQLLNFNNISFATGAVWTIEGNTAGLTDGAIDGFTGTDTIELAGFTATSDTYVSGAGLELNNGTSTVTLDITGSFTTGDFVISDTAKGTQIVVCYLRGTKILTPHGEAAIETLRIGDPIVTRFQGVQPVKWIGHQSYDRRFIQNNHDRVPVRIKAGALGRVLPARDLSVSPGHSMLIGNQLILAKSLVNGVTVTQDLVPEEVHYYQIELETHDCIQAEGTWSETYADCPGMRAQFHNAASFHELYPDFIAPLAPQLCAARPEHGPALDAALRPVVAQAEAATTPGALLGWIDKIDESGNIEGWAHDSANPHLPVLLAVFIGGTVVGTVLACDYRADLEVAGYGHGRCGFTYRLPSAAELGAVHIRRISDGAVLLFTEAVTKSRRTKAA